MRGKYIVDNIFKINIFFLFSFNSPPLLRPPLISPPVIQTMHGPQIAIPVHSGVVPPRGDPLPRDTIGCEM